MLVTSIFSFFHNVFKKILLQGRDCVVKSKVFEICRQSAIANRYTFFVLVSIFIIGNINNNNYNNKNNSKNYLLEYFELKQSSRIKDIKLISSRNKSKQIQKKQEFYLLSVRRGVELVHHTCLQ